MFSANSSQVSSAANYIEDVFSTYLYTGTGSTNSITNGIDLAGKGGMTWIKFRDPSSDGITGDHAVFDTARGALKRLRTNSTNPEGSVANSLTSFDSSGFTLGSFDQVNSGYLSRQTYASWTFRKQAKFFDVVTWTGDGTSVGNRTISHNLQSVPGFVIIKAAGATDNWYIWHRSIPTVGMMLNSTAASTGRTDLLLLSSVTSTTFTTDASNMFTNQNGVTYVAYLFAHDAGGFGTAGTDNVISCGSYTTDSSAKATINLGYEPQWVLVKRSSGADNWYLMDTMRGFAYGNTALGLQANTSSAESSMSSGANGIYPTATGFVDNGVFAASSTFIYIAIRRGPMKTPTSGTSVFSPNAVTATVGTSVTTGFPVDAQLFAYRPGYSDNSMFADRLRGVSTTATNSGPGLRTSSSAAESTPTGGATRNWNNTGFQVSGIFGASDSQIYWNFRRAPGFFDEVCWTATSDYAAQINHNLGVAPELLICKSRASATPNWEVGMYNGTQYVKRLALNLTNSSATGFVTQANPHTSTYFVPAEVSGPGNISPPDYPGNYVAYLFASCPGVSKVGSYTGTGTTKQIDCGFAAGARFVLIKRTDSTGDWYVWDSARGIVSGNDPYLLLNSTAAEVTSTDYIDPYNAGFELSSTAPAALNASGGTYIYLAIA